MQVQAAQPAQAQMNPWQINMQQRNLVLRQSVKRKQQIASTTFNPANGNVYVCNNILAVGLILRFIVEVTATFAELGSSTTAVTDFGAWNLLSNVQFTDLQNNQRHNCSGLQLGLTASMKDRQPFCSAASMAQETGNFGGNWPICVATAPTTEATGSARAVFEVPIAYDDNDLRGAIYANVVSNQMNIQFTVNPNPAPATGDDTFAVFYGGGASASLLSPSRCIRSISITFPSASLVSCFRSLTFRRCINCSTRTSRTFRRIRTTTSSTQTSVDSCHSPASITRRELWAEG